MGEIVSLILDPILHPPEPPGVETGPWRVSVYLLAFTLYLSYKVFLPSAPTDTLKDDVAESGKCLKKLSTDYDSVVVNCHKKLTILAERQLDWVSHTLNELVWEFGCFLVTIRQSPSRLGGGKADGCLAKPFGKFVCRWLSVFQECSSSPLVNPRVIVTDEIIQKCRTVTEICDAILSRLVPDPVRFVQHAHHSDQVVNGHLWEELKTLLMKPFELDDPTEIKDEPIDLRNGNTWLDFCRLNKYYMANRTRRPSYWLSFMLFPFPIDLIVLRVVLLSETHLLTILVLFFAHGFAVHEVYYEKKITAVMAVVCVALLSTLLFHFEKFDQLAELGVQTAQIQVDTTDLKTRYGRLLHFFNHSDRLTDLWTYRTRPLLGILRNLHVIIGTMTWPGHTTTQAFLEFVEAALAEQSVQIGSLDCWVGEDEVLSEESCRLIRRELERCRAVLQQTQTGAGVIRAKCHFQIIDLVAVRVIAASQLKVGERSEVFVQVGAGSSRWQKTSAITASAGEFKWHYDSIPSEFYVNVPTAPHALLEVEVWNTTRFSSTRLGRIQVNFRKPEPGEWHRLDFDLMEADQGSVEIEFYHAIRAEQLLGVVPPFVPQIPDDNKSAGEHEGDEADSKEDEWTPLGLNLKAKRAAEAGARAASAAAERTKRTLNAQANAGAQGTCGIM
eukprot:TRINITY_DN49527_c0_g1_i1.p1 TRINITY_DN49527_c0_g1~~TRINITY_DN49527_c0_g1_i1.p1  ORF type:complete len:670 (+),score=92.37 TRINITY_DN49527_c0_g1_i1:180-2189(+)